MKLPIPELPVAYELVEEDQVENLKHTAAQLADGGAEEGTLLWVKNQTNGTGRSGSRWVCGTGDLHCAIVLRPEFPQNQFADMLLVAAVSMGNALAEHLSPMTALGYIWPNKITIAGYTVASIWVEFQNQDAGWLTVSSSVNILTSPEDFSVPAMSVREAEGITDLDSGTLLKSYARQFITMINNWSENGMASIVDLWKIRGSAAGKDITINTKSHGRITATWKQIGNNGNLEIATPEEGTRVLPLSDYIERIDI